MRQSKSSKSTETRNPRGNKMPNTNFTFTVATAYGEAIDPITCTAEYETVASFDEIPPKEMPDSADILKLVNASRKASARATATAKALRDAGYDKPTLADSAELRLREMVKIFVSTGNTEEVATQKAKAALGM